MNASRYIPITLALSGLLVCLAGCPKSAQTGSQPNGNNAVSVVASPYRLTESPEGAVSLTEASEALAEQAKEICLVGKIDAGDFPAFEPDHATFMLSELPTDGHGADDPDHADNCPFCKRRAANAPKAIVQIVDDQGNVIPTNAQTLLGLQQGDRVIVIGDASFDKSVNAITLKCQKIYSN